MGLVFFVVANFAEFIKKEFRKNGNIVYTDMRDREKRDSLTFSHTADINWKYSEHKLGSNKIIIIIIVYVYLDKLCDTIRMYRTHSQPLSAREGDKPLNDAKESASEQKRNMVLCM